MQLLNRAGFYQDNAKRACLQKQVGGVDAYLASLELLWWTKDSQLAHDKLAALHEVLKRWRTTE